jgi:HK97 family phage prohead protease
MSNFEREAAWSVRESADPSVALEVSGIAVPYNDPTDIGGIREQFAPASFDPAQVIGTPLFWRHGEVVGRITNAENTDAGLIVDATVLDTTLGRDAATLVRGGASTGLSVGFIPKKSDTRAGIITHTSAHLHELSLTPVPAYAGAVITSAREEEPIMSETPAAPAVEVAPAGVDLEAREQIQTLAASIADVRTARAEVREAHPLAAYRSAGEYLQAVARVRGGQDVEAREVLTRALDEATIAANTGTNPPNWLAEIVRQVDMGRPTVSAIGARALPASGMSVTYRRVTANAAIGTQDPELEEVTSNATAITTSTANIGTLAGGVRVSLQEILRSDPSYLNELQADMVTSWNKETNGNLITLLGDAAGSTATFPGFATDEIGATLATAASTIAAAGGMMGVVIAHPAMFYRIAAAAGQGYPFAGGNVGGASFTSGSFIAMGTRFVMDAQLPSLTGLALDPSAVRYWEAGPFFLSADEPAVLGRDIACYSFSASAVLNEDAIVILND